MYLSSYVIIISETLLLYKQCCHLHIAEALRLSLMNISKNRERIIEPSATPCFISNQTGIDFYFLLPHTQIFLLKSHFTKTFLL